jgi:hypothetical protein
MINLHDETESNTPLRAVSNHRPACNIVSRGDMPQVPYPSVDQSWPTVSDAYWTSYAECRRNDSSHMQRR